MARQEYGGPATGLVPHLHAAGFGAALKRVGATTHATTQMLR